MRDFTLYLHDIDAQKFTAIDSRYGKDRFSEEWKAAWDAYDLHISHRLSCLGEDSLANYAKSGWRQDPRSECVVRGQEISRMNFALDTGKGDVSIFNSNTGAVLEFRYDGVFSLDWKGNSEILSKDLGLVLRLEELRFPEGKVEHEFVFLGGCTLLLSAESGGVNLSSYLAQCHKF